MMIPIGQVAIDYLVILLPLSLQLLGMFFVVITDPYISKKHRGILLAIVLLEFMLILQNNVEDMLSVYETLPHFRIAVSVAGYIIRPVILVLFLYIVDPLDHTKEWLMILLNSLVYLTAFFSPATISFTQNNVFHAGPLKNVCFIVSAALLADLLYQTIKKYQKEGIRELVIPFIIVGIIIASTVMDANVGGGRQVVSFLTIACVCSTVLFYIWLHLRFAREHEEDMAARQRIRIMISQIQPHFLFNTLSAIQALCETDPKAARETVEKFSLYLRQNIDSLGQEELVDFSKELEHTRTYTDIERVRFENIVIEFDIEDKDFKLPALSLQPVVENAIRHGVRIRENGLVKISSRRMDDHHEIVVCDNGKGFDAEKAFEAGEGHVGLKNVKERLERMCHGHIEVESVADEGTRVKISIPFETGKKEDGR